MPRRLLFSKLSGAGNDFVLVEGAPSRPAELARRLCDRRGAIGADGLLVLKRGRLPALRYFNADGSEAFCGNGTRCAAWWLKERGDAGAEEFSIVTAAGTLSARVTGRQKAAIAMPGPKGLRLGLDLSVAGRRLTAHFVDTGVPHAVVFVEGLQDYPVDEVGAALRRHEAFGAAGANADFVSAENGGLSLRTFERGVEAETLACGTGALAAAAAAAVLGLAESPVSVKARGGELRASFSRAGSSFSDVWLEGPARVVFTGEITS